MPVKWKYGVVAAGFSGIAGQIILLRGLETAFGGNELSLAVFFASWLSWSGAGAYFGKYLPGKCFFILLAIQGSILIPDLILIKAYPLIIDIETGVLPSINNMLIGAFLLTAPFALITGALFTTAIRFSGVKPGNIYALEALGAGLGGLTAAILLGNTDSFQIAGILFTINILIVFNRIAVSITSIAVGLFIILYLSPVMQYSILQKTYPDFEIISHNETRYGDIVITGQNELFSVFINGQLNSSYPDPYTAEESVHFPMLIHPGPQTVLLIGGGFSGAVDEVLKHPSVNKLYYAEIDAKLTQVILDNFPREAIAEYFFPEVELINADGRTWLGNTGEKFDVIITALPPPSTAQLNRYYTAEFYREVVRALNPGGVFGFVIGSSEDFIDERLAEFLAGLQYTMQTSFSHSAVLPGYNACFLGSLSEIDFSPDSMIVRIAERNLENEFISPHYLPHRLSPENFDYLKRCIEKEESPWINRDFFPAAYINFLKMWESQFHLKRMNLLDVAGKTGITVSMSIIAFMLLMAMLRLRGSGFDKSVKLAVFTTGMSQIGIQLLILMGFQSLYGYLYYQQAVLIAAFMVGAAAGSWFSGKSYKAKTVIKKIHLLRIQLILIIFPLLIMFLFHSLENLPHWMKHILAITAFMSGGMGGIQYSLAADYIKGKPALIGGGLYAFDLAGAALGAIITGIILIPAAGFFVTALILSTLSIIPAGFMIIYHKGR